MRILAIDCGGTSSSALVLSSRGEVEVVASGKQNPANLYTSGPTGVADTVAAFLRTLPPVEGLALAVAGVRTEEDRQRLIAAMREASIHLPVAVYSDAHAALRAGGVRSGVALIAGTGSAALAVAQDGTEKRLGGWGSVLGDEGSGYWIGREALWAVVRAADEDQRSDPLIRQAILQHFRLSSVHDLRTIAYGPDARTRIASLAPVVAGLQAESPVAAQLLSRAADELARLALLARRSVSFDSNPVLVLSGGVLRGVLTLQQAVWKRVEGAFSWVELPEDPTWGAYLLATEDNRWDHSVAAVPTWRTEEVNPRSASIDRLDTLEILRLMNEEDAKVAPAVGRALESVARVVDEAAARLASGGRLIYVGAGSSGRLALLDAVECVPTFGTDPGQVVALIAGGEAALTRAVEGAEDDAGAGEAAVDALGVAARDVVVGVSASGSAAYVRAALSAARSRGACTALVTANPATEATRQVAVPVVLDVGPEVIAGSTRLKAGTAQKLVLNMISTATMIRLGRTLGNRMVSVRPTNRKLRVRAVRLVAELSGAGNEAARTALEQTGWRVAEAALLLESGSEEAMRAALADAGGAVRQALERARGNRAK